ncbi:MAG: D-2-hydroxyacid dehydrogenase [Clostridia bacterium]|nr:D-2-hydroxyacid dehydrogenase [Clostridia bacterium]
MERRLTVAVEQLNDAQRERIRAAAAGLGLTAEFYPGAQAALPHVKDSEVILGSSPALAANAPRLRWFCATSAGVEPYLKPGAFLAPDALLTNSSGAYGVTIAEHTIMVTLELMRRQQEYTAIVDRRQWKRDLAIRSIRNSRVALLGTGDIGGEVAKRLRPFEPARIIGVNRSGRNPGGLYDDVIPVDRLDSLLPETDLLIISLPGTQETTGLIDDRRLRLLPSDAFLVNVGRGTVIDQSALEAALRERYLGGAALDVFEQEPLDPASTLWTCPRLLITPHCAGNMTLAYTVDRIVDLFLEDLRAYAKGNPLARSIDRTKGY